MLVMGWTIDLDLSTGTALGFPAAEVCIDGLRRSSCKHLGNRESEDHSQGPPLLAFGNAAHSHASLNLTPQVGMTSKQVCSRGLTG